MTPILLVHGIWNTGRNFALMQQALGQAGARRTEVVELEPNTGVASIRDLAAQVAEASKRLCTETRATHLDLVGFSMGALVSRYFIQRLGGAARVRRFVSISGPHHGTLTAYALPHAGVRDMRPGSALLRELDDSAEVFRDVELHCLWTPFDLMIVPPTSSVLPGARSSWRFPVLLHRFMLTDRRVIERVAELLHEPTA